MANGWVAEGLSIHATFNSRLIGGGMEIQHFAIIGGSLKPVGEAFLENEGFVIVGAERLGMPAQKSR